MCCSLPELLGQALAQHSAATHQFKVSQMVVEAIFSLMKTSSMYAEVACWIASFFVSVASTIACMINGATLSLKPICIKQYLFPSKITVWYSHKDLCLCTCIDTSKIEY